MILHLLIPYCRKKLRSDLDPVFLPLNISLSTIRCNSLDYFLHFKTNRCPSDIRSYTPYDLCMCYLSAIPVHRWSAWAPRSEGRGGRRSARNFWDGPWHALGRPQLISSFCLFYSFRTRRTRAAAQKDFEVHSGSFIVMAGSYDDRHDLYDL